MAITRVQIAALAGLVVVLAALAPRSDAAYGEVPKLTVGCNRNLTGMYTTYESTTQNLTYLGQPCDASCLKACSTTIQDALKNENTGSSGCPSTQNLRGCLKVFEDQWVSFVSNCELFSSQKAITAGEAEGSSQRLKGCFPEIKTSAQFSQWLKAEDGTGSAPKKDGAGALRTSGLVLFAGLVGAGVLLAAI